MGIRTKKYFCLFSILLLLLLNLPQVSKASNGEMTWSSKIKKGSRFVWEVSVLGTNPGSKLLWSYGPGQLSWDKSLKMPSIMMDTGQRLRIEITKTPTVDSFPEGKVSIDGLWNSNGSVSLRNTSWIVPTRWEEAYSYLTEDPQRGGGDNSWISDRVSTRGGILTGVGYNSSTGILLWYEMYFSSGHVLIEFIGEYPPIELEFFLLILSAIVGLIITMSYAFLLSQRAVNKYWTTINCVAYFIALILSYLFFIPSSGIELLANPLLSFSCSIISVISFNWILMIKSDQVNGSTKSIRRLKEYLEERKPRVLAAEFLLIFIFTLIIFEFFKTNHFLSRIAYLSSKYTTTLIQAFSVICLLILALFGIAIIINYRNEIRIRIRKALEKTLEKI